MFVKRSDRSCSQSRLRRSLSVIVLAVLILECFGEGDSREAYMPAESVEYLNSALTDEKFEEDGFIRYLLVRLMEGANIKFACIES